MHVVHCLDSTVAHAQPMLMSCPLAAEASAASNKGHFRVRHFAGVVIIPLLSTCCMSCASRLLCAPRLEVTSDL